jgi:hypothetical protein
MAPMPANLFVNRTTQSCLIAVPASRRRALSFASKPCRLGSPHWPERAAGAFCRTP